MIITAIVGTYRRNGIIDRIVDEILYSAKGQGAQINKIFIIDKHIEFCTNCRVNPHEWWSKQTKGDSLPATQSAY